MATILVVDDEDSIRHMIKEGMSDEGHSFLEASNGDEAIKVVNDQCPDLVITDLVMPNVNGLDLIMNLRKRHPDLPIIAISGGGGIQTNYDYLQISKLIGARCVLSKPFSLRELSKIVEENLPAQE